MNNKFANSLLLVGFVIGSWGLGHAQTVSTPTPPQLPPMPGPGVITTQVGGPGMGFQFVSSEPAVSTRVVKGAPYSLEATIETAQILSDGNRIVHRQTVRLFRDTEGRTRREETLSAIGPWAAAGSPPTIVTIQDPVSRVTYSLDPQNKIATKLPSAMPSKTMGVFGVHTVGGEMSTNKSPEGAAPNLGFAAVAGGFDAAGGGDGFVTVQNGTPVQTVIPEETSESLGKETIAGVSGDGTRTSTTIPANTIGNERPIEIIRERWYSPELQIVLRSKQSDPRFGETTYDVTRLDRGKPAHALFEVPSDYQVRDAPVFLPPVPLPK
jgi:hypothetical protein